MNHFLTAEIIMLELLNPTPLDVIRFAAQTLSFRRKVQSLYKTSPGAAYSLVAERFMTPPESARRAPTLARLQADGKRFFGWSGSQWSAVEPALANVINNAKRSSLTHLNETVQCYQWLPKKSVSAKPRGRMLLCHGWEGYAFSFAALISAAVEDGWEVIAFDHLSHGESSGTRSGLPIALSTLLAVAASAGRVDVLVGHSLGGAAAAWANANGKIAAKRLVLLAPFYDTLHLTRMWAKAHLLADHFRTGLQSELERTAGLTFEDFMPQQLAPQFSQPVLIIHDPKDPVTGFKHSRQLAALNERIELVAAEKMGHIRLLANPEYIERVVKFASA
jgi:pimeloyl-ACP methyl ester carboxylesterase